MVTPGFQIRHRLWKHLACLFAPSLNGSSEVFYAARSETQIPSKTGW